MDSSTGELRKVDPKWGICTSNTEGSCPPPSAKESLSKPLAPAQLEGGVQVLKRLSMAWATQTAFLLPFFR